MTFFSVINSVDVDDSGKDVAIKGVNFYPFLMGYSREIPLHLSNAAGGNVCIWQVMRALDSSPSLSMNIS
jgi:hypothetical protein